MQHPYTAPSAPVERTESAAPVRRAADVPSDQLWRQAIDATREAASAAAELRRALGAARPRPGTA